MAGTRLDQLLVEQGHYRTRARARDAIKRGCVSVDGKAVVSYVPPEGAAVKAGLSVNDEIIAVGGWRAGSDLSGEIDRLSVNEAVEIIYARNGKVSRAVLIPEASTSVKFAIQNQADKSKSQADLFDIWLD